MHGLGATTWPWKSGGRYLHTYRGAKSPTAFSPQRQVYIYLEAASDYYPTPNSDCYLTKGSRRFSFKFNIIAECSACVFFFSLLVSLEVSY